MSLISTSAKVKVTSKNAKYYEELGYTIPHKINKYNDYVIAVNEEIIVNVNDLPRYSNAKVIVKCDCCGKEKQEEYSRYRETLRENKKNYCIKCYSTVINTGCNNYRWNPSLTDEEREQKRRSLPGYVDFIKKVLARDNYICKCCGKTNARMEVHHLDGYDWCKEKRTDIANGITLCKNCHKNFHTKYGRGGNTKEQFEEWIGKTVDLLDFYNGILPVSRELYCIEENKTYSSVKNFADKHKIKSLSTISKVCNCAKILATHPELKTVKKSSKEYLPKTIKGYHIFWLDDYNKLSLDEINRYIKSSEKVTRGIKIVCLNTLEIFKSIQDCSYKCKIHSDTIKNCCNNHVSYKRRDGTIFNFQYLTDYIKQNNLTLDEAQKSLFFIT